MVVSVFVSCRVRLRVVFSRVAVRQTVTRVSSDRERLGSVSFGDVGGVLERVWSADGRAGSGCRVERFSESDGSFGERLDVVVDDLGARISESARGAPDETGAGRDPQIDGRDETEFAATEFVPQSMVLCDVDVREAVGGAVRAAPHPEIGAVNVVVAVADHRVTRELLVSADSSVSAELSLAATWSGSFPSPLARSACDIESGVSRLDGPVPALFGSWFVAFMSCG